MQPFFIFSILTYRKSFRSQLSFVFFWGEMSKADIQEMCRILIFWFHVVCFIMETSTRTLYRNTMIVEKSMRDERDQLMMAVRTYCI